MSKIMNAILKPLIVLDARYPHLLEHFAPEFEVAIAPLDERLPGLETDGRRIRAIITGGNLPMPPCLADLPQLGLIALIGSGFEAINVAGLGARGVAVTHSPGLNVSDVATHAVALFLGHNRLLVDNDARVRSGAWRNREVNNTIRSVAGLKVGVLGLGDIGRGIARRLKGFDCEIAWWGPRPKPDEALPRRESLMDLARWCDVLFVAARADASNHGLIDAAVLEALGRAGVIVNISRGSIIEEDALIAALRDGRLGGAALDVFVDEPTPGDRWRDVPRTTLSPHTGAAGELARREMGKAVLANLRLFFAGKPLATPVPA